MSDAVAIVLGVGATVVVLYCGIRLLLCACLDRREEDDD
jgi:hypothetical protein